MKKFLVGLFGLLFVLAIMCWVVGILGGSLGPLFSARHFERIGQIGLAVACIGEGATYLIGWIFGRTVSR